MFYAIAARASQQSPPLATLLTNIMQDTTMPPVLVCIDDDDVDKVQFVLTPGYVGCQVGLQHRHTMHVRRHSMAARVAGFEATIRKVMALPHGWAQEESDLREQPNQIGPTLGIVFVNASEEAWGAKWPRMNLPRGALRWISMQPRQAKRLGVRGPEVVKPQVLAAPSMQAPRRRHLNKHVRTHQSLRVRAPQVLRALRRATQRVRRLLSVIVGMSPRPSRT